MLINALCEYSDRSGNGRGFSAEGFAEQNIHFRIILNKDGTLAGCYDIRQSQAQQDKKGKEKMVPQKVILPERTQKTAIDSNFIEHRPLYIFGLNYDKGKYLIDSKAEKSHAAFVKHELQFFDGIESDLCRAYRTFVEKWQPEKEINNEILLGICKDYKGSYFAFGFADGRKLEEDKEFIEKYNKYLRETKSIKESENVEAVTCPVLGKRSVPARIHDKIKFPGGLSSGCTLVSMKEPAYESYGKEQSYNSNVSEEAMRKYSGTLNWLLANKGHRTVLFDLTIVYFAMKKNDDIECDYISSLFGTSAQNADDATGKALDEAVKLAASGKQYEIGEIDRNVTFYLVGLTANSSRICQKFIYHDSFGNIADNISQHQRDMRVSIEEKKQISFYKMGKELTSPKSTNDTVSPPLMTEIIIAAISGGEYPRALFENMIRRIKTDSDTETNHFIKINDTRIGILKAYLNRKNRKKGKEEVITMSLNNENMDPAYLCGRLFAVYEKIQRDSSGGGLNRTIKDAYYASACSTPSVIFPRLDKLAQNHLKKLSERESIYFQKLLGDIMSGLNGIFPKTLNLDSQGSFIIGYYQQNKALYTSKKDQKEDFENE